MRNSDSISNARVPKRAGLLKQRLWVRGSLAAVVVLFAVWAGATPPPKVLEPAVVPWTFRADWTQGFSGWMSFPLAQDVGYDPSLYTEQEGPHTVLLHTFLSHGQSRPQFGLIRPLKFWTGPEARFEVGYRLKIAGRLSGLTLTLVGTDGRLYSAPLPSGDGEHAVQLRGRDLGVTTLTPMDAIILRGRLLAPPEGCTSRWVLERFVAHAARPPEVALARPKLVSSPQQAQVVPEIFHVGQPLKLVLKSSLPSLRVSLFKGQGNPVNAHVRVLAGRQVAIALGDHATPGLWRAEVAQGAARTAFRFLVLGKIPPHPRLLLSNERLEALRSDERYAGLREQIHRRAERLATHLTDHIAVGNDINLMPSGPGIGPAFPGQLRPYFEVANEYASAVAYNALDYRLNGNPNALAAARRALLTMIQWKAWVPPRWRSHGLRTYYEVGVFTQLVAFGYDLIADELTPQEKAAVAQAFWEKVIEPTSKEYFSYNRDPIGASNWMANSLGGAIAAAVADAGDTAGWDHREGPALTELTCAFEQLLRGLFPGDGSEAEPIGYENFAMQGISWGMSGLGALGVRPQGARRVFEGFWWPYYATARPRRELDTGDFDGRLKGLSGFAWTAEHAGIPALRSFYDAGTHLNLSHGSPVGPNGHFFEEMLGPLDLACCSKPPQPFNPPPPSRVFPKRGSAVLRSGWNPASTVISLRVGPWFNHEHHDEGSFQVAAFGQELIAEAGHANYYTDPHYADYFSQASGHNTVLVDDDPFSQGAFAGRYWSGFAYPHFTSQLLAGAFDYLAADLTSAYDGRLKSYRREFFFLKPDILIVRDRLRAAGNHTFSWLLHTPPGSRLQMDGAQASIERQKASALLTALGPNTTWKEARTPIPAELFKDLDHKDIQPRREFILTSPRAATAQFLVGMKFVSAADRQATGLQPWREAAGEGLKSTDGESAAMVFRTGNGWLQIGSLRTDGTTLARQGPKNHPSWLALGALQVQEEQRVIFAATSPVDVAEEERAGIEEFDLNNSASARLQVLRINRPRSVEVDGRSADIVYRGGMVVLPLLPPGEHRVAIR